MQLSAEDLSPEHEIYKGRGYRLYSAETSGKLVAVKLYEGRHAKQRCIYAANFNQKVMHPNIPHMFGVSAFHSELPFLVLHGDYEGAVESRIALALSKDLKQSLLLGLQTIVGLSSGLDYLRSIRYSFASVRLNQFVILLSRKGKIMISFDPEVQDKTADSAQQDKQPAVVDGMGKELDIFHGLCKQTFDAACKTHYESQRIHDTYIDELDEDLDDLDESQLENLDDDVQLPATESAEQSRTLKQLHVTLTQSHGSNLTQILVTSMERQLPLWKLRRKAPTSGSRRELVWKPSITENISLHDISHQFQDFLAAFPSSENLSLKGRRGRYISKAAHRCPGYNRIEITLTTDITRSAFVSHFTPTPHEICPVCKEVVKDAEIFNCICGGYDDESMPTVRCSTCQVWQHRLCDTVSEFGGQNFVCQRCHVIKSNSLLGKRTATQIWTLTPPSATSRSQRSGHRRTGSLFGDESRAEGQKGQSQTLTYTYHPTELEEQEWKSMMPRHARNARAPAEGAVDGSN
ncbi:hypothetical protein B0H34DRAFT_796306 [Crassisporium funariophilum]|nr:hypothetical protein B0H34DRAFT_796306 [Crassisporium funariophilum]